LARELVHAANSLDRLQLPPGDGVLHRRVDDCRQHSATGVRFLFVFALFVSFGVLLVAPVRVAALTKGHVVVTDAFPVVAVMVPPVGHDMSAYAMYGRIVPAYHANPDTHIPADYPKDPLLMAAGRARRPCGIRPLVAL
jgi:hypothetical protein